VAQADALDQLDEVTDGLAGGLRLTRRGCAHHGPRAVAQARVAERIGFLRVATGPLRHGRQVSGSMAVLQAVDPLTQPENERVDSVGELGRFLVKRMDRRQALEAHGPRIGRGFLRIDGVRAGRAILVEDGRID